MKLRTGAALTALALALPALAAVAGPAQAAPVRPSAVRVIAGGLAFAQPEADNAAAQARAQHEPAVDDMITPGVGLAEICDDMDSGACLTPDNPNNSSGEVTIRDKANAEPWEVECQGEDQGAGCNVTMTWPFDVGTGMNSATYNDGHSYVVNLDSQSGDCAYESGGDLYWHENGCVTGAQFVVYRWTIISVLYSDTEGSLFYTTSEGYGNQVQETNFFDGTSQWGN